MTAGQTIELSNIVISKISFSLSTTVVSITLIKDDKTELLVDNISPKVFDYYIDATAPSMYAGFDLGHLKIKGSDRLVITSSLAVDVLVYEDKIESDYYIKYLTAVTGITYKNVLYFKNNTDNLQLVFDSVNIVTDSITYGQDDYFMRKLNKLTDIQLLESGTVFVGCVNSFSESYKRNDIVSKMKLANRVNYNMKNILLPSEEV